MDEVRCDNVKGLYSCPDCGGHTWTRIEEDDEVWGRCNKCGAMHKGE